MRNQMLFLGVAIALAMMLPISTSTAASDLSSQISGHKICYPGDGGVSDFGENGDYTYTNSKTGRVSHGKWTTNGRQTIIKFSPSGKVRADWMTVLGSSVHIVTPTRDEFSGFFC